MLRVMCVVLLYVYSVMCCVSITDRLYLVCMCVCHVCMYMHFMYELVCMCDLHIALCIVCMHGMYDIYGMSACISCMSVCMTYSCMYDLCVGILCTAFMYSCMYVCGLCI